MSEGSDYLANGYDYEGRFASYWHQIQEIIKITKSGSLLEIGPGNNFLKDYLSKRGFCVETLDMSADSNPTYRGSVTSIPCNDRQYDCVTAFEVLEHLPFTEFKSCLKEMARVSKRGVIISMPDVRWFVSARINIFSSAHGFRQILSFPRLTNRNLKAAKGPEDHFWEIGRPGTNVNKILNEINDSGLTLYKHYRIPSNPIHHIFVLIKEE